MQRRFNVIGSRLVALTAAGVVMAAAATAAPDAIAAPSTSTIKPTTILMQLSPGLATPLQVDGISFGPVPPATSAAGLFAPAVALPVSGTVKLKNGAIQSSSLTMSGGMSFAGIPGGPIPTVPVTLQQITTTLNGTSGTVTGRVTDYNNFNGYPKPVSTLSMYNLTVTNNNKQIRGFLSFTSPGSTALIAGLPIPEFLAGRPFGYFRLK